jgi:hypothetical protein
MAEYEKVCQHFGLSYTMRTALQACSKWKLVKDVAKAVGQGSAFGEVIQVLALYCMSSLLLRFCWNNMSKLCAPLYPWEDFYK